MISFESEEQHLPRIREQLSEMTDVELLEYAKSIRALVYPHAVRAKPTTFDNILEIAGAEWQRRHAKL